MLLIAAWYEAAVVRFPIAVRLVNAIVFVALWNASFLLLATALGFSSKCSGIALLVCIATLRELSLWRVRQSLFRTL